MSSDAAAPSSRLDEALSAYLDGELDVAASREVERRLAGDEAAGLRLRQMERAWDLLDELPRAATDDRFTTTTLTLAAQAAEADQAKAAHGRRRTRLLAVVGAAAICLVAGLVGFALFALRLDRGNQRLVRELPVIENVDLYTHAESADFLRRLQAEGLFPEDADASP